MLAIPTKLLPSCIASSAMLLATANCVAATPAAGAAAYPGKNIRFIVPYNPGAGTDFTARQVAGILTEAGGQQVLIDNRPGASATIGHALGAKAPADGYTLLLGTTGGMVSGPALVSNLPYDPIKDFTPISVATYVPYVLAVSATLPVKNVRELIDLAKSQPGKLNFASPGLGTPNHLGGAMLMMLSGIDLVHIPYKAAAMSLPDMASGSVHMTVQSFVPLQPFVQSGKIRVLGVGHNQRTRSAPDIPLISDTVPGYYNTGWWGLVGPANLPQPIVEKLNAMLVKGMQQPSVQQTFLKAGLEPAHSTPQEYSEMIKADLQTWRKLIKDANIKVDSLP